MKKGSTIFLQAVVILVSIVTLAIMIRFPMTEGRAANLDLLHIYADPFIIYGYLASSAFFVALYQAFRLLGYIRQDKVFSLDSVKALKKIKYCAIILSSLIVLAALYIRITFAFAGDESDDPAGFLAMAIITTFISVVVAAAAGVFEGVLEKGMKT